MAVALLTCGCVSARRISAEPVAVPLAVVPFDSLSGDPNAGLALAGQVEDALLRRGVMAVSRETVRAALAGAEGDVLSPEELGRRIGAPTLLLGQVVEYRYKSGVGEQPVVVLNVRLVRAEGGAVLWSARVAKTGSYSLLKSDSLGRLGQSVSDGIAAAVAQAVREGQP